MENKRLTPSDFNIEFEGLNLVKCFFSLKIGNAIEMNGGFVYAVVSDKEHKLFVNWTMFNFLDNKFKKDLEHKIIKQLISECEKDNVWEDLIITILESVEITYE